MLTILLSLLSLVSSPLVSQPSPLGESEGASRELEVASYTRCNSLSDIVDGGTYIIVISNGTKHYAIQQNSDNNAAEVTPDAHGYISNPSSSITWTAVASTSTQNEEGFKFKCNSKYMYYSSSFLVSNPVGSSSTWVISQLNSEAKDGEGGLFKIDCEMKDGRYIGWDGSKFTAYKSTNFKNQFDENVRFGQYCGALYIYKECECPPLWGDVNNDGSADIVDLTLLISKLNGGNPIPFNATAADVDGKNGVTLDDVEALRSEIMKK